MYLIGTLVKTFLEFLVLIGFSSSSVLPRFFSFIRNEDHVICDSAIVAFQVGFATFKFSPSCRVRQQSCAHVRCACSWFATIAGEFDHTRSFTSSSPPCFQPQVGLSLKQGRFQGGQGPQPPVKFLPPPPKKKVQDQAATCQNFLHYISTNEFAYVYVFII